MRRSEQISVMWKLSLEQVKGEYMADKMKIVIWGYCIKGVKALEVVRNIEKYEFIGFADNSIYKQGNYVYGKPIYSMGALCELDRNEKISVVIAIDKWKEVVSECEKKNIRIEAIYIGGEMHPYPFPTFESLDYSKMIRFYAGDICDDIHKSIEGLYGLSLRREDSRHIRHDVREKYCVPDNSVESYEAEDVFEYVEEEKQIDAINEIYRILKPHGYVRFTLPDYNSPYLKRRTMCDKNGKMLFDVGGGGSYGAEGIQDNGSIYFATYENFNKILEGTKFKKIEWLCYYTEDGTLYKKYIDMEKGYVNRVNNESDEDVYCLVVDCYKLNMDEGDNT